VKRTGLILTSLALFALSLYAAYVQGVQYLEINGLPGGHLVAPAGNSVTVLSHFWANYLNVFATILNGLANVFFNSMVAAIIVLALIVELITLYPAVNLQLKQKKIHLFHKKLVDRFHRGEITMSESKRELDILYSVNERIHRRGAWLFASQLIVFVLILLGLRLVAAAPSALWSSFSTFNFSLLYSPSGISLPLLAGLAYLLHSLVKIHLKQREDYISMKQVYTALFLAIVGATLVFYFASIFAVLLTVYFLTLITFATMRYIIVEENAKAWGKYVQRELIKLLKTSKLHKNKMERWSRKFNHMPIMRHLNFHLLEEAASMSLAIVMFLNGLMLL
jgi:membrane protein insertase Oxa1/YidC/SpoIIIJ